MASLKTPITVLQASAIRNPDLPVLKIPRPESSEPEWETVSYAQFLHDVEACAAFWTRQLTSKGWKTGSVVGLWLKGLSYSDIVQLWGIMRAGFIPQAVSFRMSSPLVVYELLRDSGAVALIYEPSIGSRLSDSPVDVFPAISEFDQVHNQDSLVRPVSPPASPDDTVILLHTSGTTSGRPKLVSLSVNWWTSAFVKFDSLGEKPLYGAQLVSVAAGSFGHRASIVFLAQITESSACIVIPTTLPYSSSELRAMTQQCGLTDFTIFPAFLSRMLAEARQDASLLALLKGFRYVHYGGGALSAADVEWALDNGLALVEHFASTEVGTMLRSRAGSVELERDPRTAYEFVPLHEGPDPDQQEPLLELVVLPESPDCPGASLRNKDTGKFHTGDLFVRVGPDRYLWRGRNDDWIKMEMALRCDTGSLESNALETCGGDLIDAAVVIGTGRASPVLVVEPKQAVAGAWLEKDGALLKREVLQRIKPFHATRYSHERIDDERFILVVPRGSLPRTAKGSIQRKSVEATFQQTLDEMF